MKRLLTTALLLGTAASYAQLSTHTSMYISPGEEVHVFENMTNESLTRIDEGGVLYVDGSLTNNSTMTFENSASLLRGSVGNDGSGTGTYNVKRLGSSGDVYNYWSSPIQAANDIPGTASYFFNAHNGTESYADDLDPDPGWTQYNGLMTVGRGYAGFNSGQVTFTGQVNNGNVNFPLTYYPASPGNTAPGTPSNLCGNPYPSAISCMDLVITNTDIDGAIYFWDDDLSAGTNYSYTDYAVWNGTGSLGTGAGTTPPNGFISSCQGFMVRAASPGATLNMNNGMRSANNSQFFRMADNTGSRLWLSLGNGELYNQMLFAVLDDATDGRDRLYDAEKIRGNSNIALASMLGTDEFCIQALGAGYDERIVPLVTHVATGGQFTFSADSIEGFEEGELILYDNRSHTEYPLFQGAEYTFTISPIDEFGRFQLGVGSPATDLTEEESSEMFMYVHDHDLMIQDATVGDGMVQLFDMTGRMVWSESTTLMKGLNRIGLPQTSMGQYVIRVQTESETTSIRSILN